MIKEIKRKNYLKSTIILVMLTAFVGVFNIGCFMCLWLLGYGVWPSIFVSGEFCFFLSLFLIHKYFDSKNFIKDCEK